MYYTKYMIYITFIILKYILYIFYNNFLYFSHYDIFLNPLHEVKKSGIF